MIAKVLGYKVLNKNDRMLCLISYIRDARKDTGEVGLIAETNFLPPYCIDKVDTYLGQLCTISFHKYNDKYTISNVEPIAKEHFNTD